jgi:hypothetical protein
MPTPTRRVGRLIASLPGLLVCLFAASLSAQDQRRPVEPGPILKELTLQGATVFNAEDLAWLLHLRTGAPLPGPPEHVAELVKDRYERDGYTEARVDATYDAATGRLTLRVDEGRIDAVEVTGLEAERAARIVEDLGVRPGDVYNKPAVHRSVQRLLDETQGAWRIGPADVDLVERGGRRVLVIPIARRNAEFGLGFSSEDRIELFNPVDGFAPSLELRFVRFDRHGFNHTFVGGQVSYGFAREKPGLAIGFEQPLFGRRRAFLGAEIHDLTASDDHWRLSMGEQSLVALTFKNTFKDYYRRRGAQLFGAFRPHDTQEFLASMRWDEHESLQNETDFSFFRDDHEFRPNRTIAGGTLRALVLGYTFDTRGLSDDDPEATYERHLADDLFRGTRRQAFGWRTDWTSEIAGHGLGGDYEFDRHILNTRAYVPLSNRHSLAARLIVGFGGGELPVERQFAIGGIGSVRGYAFKEAAGERMTLANLEYRFDIVGRGSRQDFGSVRLLLLFDAGRVQHPIGGSSTDWLRGTGLGIQTGPIRVEFGFRLNDIPDSRQILVRLGPTF